MGISRGRLPSTVTKITSSPAGDPHPPRGHRRLRGGTSQRHARGTRRPAVGIRVRRLGGIPGNAAIARHPCPAVATRCRTLSSHASPRCSHHTPRADYHARGSSARRGWPTRYGRIFFHSRTLPSQEVVRGEWRSGHAREPLSRRSTGGDNSTARSAIATAWRASDRLGLTNLPPSWNIR
jgi:hypothetical protein